MPSQIFDLTFGKKIYTIPIYVPNQNTLFGQKGTYVNIRSHDQHQCDDINSMSAMCS